jgi:poly(A) polymerase
MQNQSPLLKKDLAGKKYTPMDEPILPRIVPRQGHSLSRQSIDPDALKISNRLINHGFTTYLVGGCVRDLLLKKTPKDFDVVTNAHPQQIHDLFRNSRLIGHRFRLAHVYFKGGKYIEVSTFRRRSEFEEEEKEHPHTENTFGTPAEDASRRDITINAIFYNIADLSLLDYVGGLDDLQNGIIRCIGDPEEKFVQDPVRMIRVLRHAARTGFTIEEKTYQALFTYIQKLFFCSPSRLRDEFMRELREGAAKESMHLMIKTGMLDIFFPALFSLLQKGDQQTFFLKLMDALDTIQVGKNSVADEFCLSLFFLILLKSNFAANDFPSGRKGQALYQLRVHEWVMNLLEPLQFPRRVKEMTSHLLGSQRIFREFLPLGRLPWLFMKKPFFAKARLLFELDAQIQGVDIGTITWQPAQRKFRKRKHKRHRGKARKLASHSENAGEKITTQKENA